MLTPNKLLADIVEDGHWDMECAEDYAEPGYAKPTRSILFADWNDETRRGTDDERRMGEYWPVVSTFRSRVANILANAGFDCQWSDEWAVCECGKAVRTQPDSYIWTPAFAIKDGEFVCLECWADCLSVGDRIEYCRDMGVSIFAARRNTIPIKGEN